MSEDVAWGCAYMRKVAELNSFTSVLVIRVIAERLCQRDLIMPSFSASAYR